MPLENPKQQQNQIISQENSEQNHLKITIDRSEDAYVERIIAEAIQHSDETEEPISDKIMVTEIHEKMAQEISFALGLAFGVTLNSAIKYALFHAQQKGVNLDKLEEYPSHIGSHVLKMKVTLETLHRIKESGVREEQLSECVVVGIQLLYKRLIDERAKG